MGNLIAVQGGAVGLLGVVVWFILTGRLVPLSVLRDAHHQRDTYQAANQELLAALAEEREQKRQLLEVAHVTEHVLTALPRPGEVGHGVAGTDEAAAR